MKFALRDDDLNYFYTPCDIENNYNEIWDICPVSMSVVPFMKGNWPKNVKDAEKRGPGNLNKQILKKLISNNNIYPIGDNNELVDFIKQKIVSKKIHLTSHGIHHRNEDDITPQLSGNFGFGAEFFTNRDLTEELSKAIIYLEETFGQSIEVFTPPQNLYSKIGLKAIVNNNLALCADLLNFKSIDTLKLIGLKNYIKILLFKVFNRGSIYPYLIVNNKFKLINHHRLQPGTDILKLYSKLDETYNKNGVFVLSTHSYAFDYEMKNSKESMGKVLKEIVAYAATKENIEFVNLKQIFE
jgi:predicted deacetylase